MPDPNAAANAEQTRRITDTLDNLAEAPDAFRQEIAAGAEEMGLDAQWRTPVRYGKLKGSKSVKHNLEGSRIIFGGPAAWYARHVHENLHARHKTGEAKFLERAVQAGLPELEKRFEAILAAIRAAS